MYILINNRIYNLYKYINKQTNKRKTNTTKERMEGRKK